jgi:hypothetical protein
MLLHIRGGGGIENLTRGRPSQTWRPVAPLPNLALIETWHRLLRILSLLRIWSHYWIIKFQFCTVIYFLMHVGFAKVTLGHNYLELRLFHVRITWLRHSHVSSEDRNVGTGWGFSQSQSHFVTDSQSVCLSWCRAPSRAHDQILILFESYSSVHMGRPLWGILEVFDPASL